jgi:D-alanine-D-alanine ligase
MISDLLRIKEPSYLGIIYSSSNSTTAGRELEKLADQEIIETALSVKLALEGSGYSVDLVDLAKTPVKELQKYDWIFNLTESIVGFPMADFEVAGALESLAIPFTGSGSAALKACLDKSITKRLLNQHHIQTPAFEVIYTANDLHTNLKFPLIVKPVHEDGGVGIFNDSIVNNEVELQKTVTRILNIYQQPALVEEYIEGRDITVSILGNNNSSIVFPPSECIYPDPTVKRILSFEANWIPTATAYQTIVSICPCELEEDEDVMLRDVARTVYNLMGCRDYARVDFRMREKTPYVLEVNPNPCINPVDSGFVRAGIAVGYSYNQLINKILESSVEAWNFTHMPATISESV